MSFFKTIVVVGIAIAILPTDQEKQRQLTQTAMSVSSEARTFCASRPNICISREEAWHGFVAKAGFAFTLGQELIWGQHVNATQFGEPYSEDAYDDNRYQTRLYAPTQRRDRRQRDGIGSLLQSNFTSN